MALKKKLSIPQGYRKKTTLGGTLSYDELEIHDNKVVGFLNGNQNMTWFFKEYLGIDVIKANMNSQFGQIVFLTGINSQNRVIGPDLGMQQNMQAMKDTNRIVFCAGMFSFDKTNQFVQPIAKDIKEAFESFKENEGDGGDTVVQPLSEADELRKFKDLLDSGVITQEEFNAKKKQLLGL